MDNLENSEMERTLMAVALKPQTLVEYEDFLAKLYHWVTEERKKDDKTFAPGLFNQMCLVRTLCGNNFATKKQILTQAGENEQKLSQIVIPPQLSSSVEDYISQIIDLVNKKGTDCLTAPLRDQLSFICKTYGQPRSRFEIEQEAGRYTSLRQKETKWLMALAKKLEETRQAFATENPVPLESASEQEKMIWKAQFFDKIELERANFMEGNPKPVKNW
jgi:hypothetical protein